MGWLVCSHYGLAFGYYLRKTNVMDIGSGKGYPSSALSNFAPHPFEIDFVLCNSMEGFLQSLKFQNQDMQIYVCSLVGFQAKYKGKQKRWWTTQKLYWRGMEMDRHGKEYQDLLDRAYDALAKNSGFRAALLATGNATLTHSMGKADPHHTVLTKNEFCSRLLKIRERMKNL
jgi:predicted NAD-dependent protein-ADP-ribosyltransferase YbiA (DUF1768 family)